jgi:hypothetical protein
VTTIAQATGDYERWLGERVPLVHGDLERKHARMRESPFLFLRATYYRWARRFPELLPDLVSRVPVPSVGDLHFDNFGTWRDAEGRLVWGVNVFDEAGALPYTNDLVRLATSVLLTRADGRVTLDPSTICATVLHGYRIGLTGIAQPTIVDEHRWLGRLIRTQAPKPKPWWRALDRLSEASELPPEAELALALVSPGPDWSYQLHARIAGVGSLGRRRLLARGHWEGGPVARELKQAGAQASDWLGVPPGTQPRAPRSADPLCRERDGWLARRLAPDCLKLELASLDRRRDERRLLTLIGAETARIHAAGTCQSQAIQADLDTRPSDWLEHAADRMERDTRDDWHAWREQA